MIVLFNPISAPPGKTYLPLSLLALGAVLEGRYEYELVDGNLEREPTDHLIKLLSAAENQPAILGVTVMPGPQLKQAVEVCRKVRDALPNLPIIWGGYFPTEHTEVCLKADYVDYIVRSQGEETFLELLAWLDKGDRTDSEGLAAIKGISYTDPVSGTMRHNIERVLISPQKLPTLPYHRVNMNDYLIETAVGRRTLPHSSSYGCPFHCNFCAVVKMVEGSWLAESGERTAMSVRYLHEQFGADSVIFVDNNFFALERRVRKFSEKMLEFGLGDKVKWWGEGRVDTLIKYKPETWELIKKAGCKMIFMGAESGSDETLAQMNKGGTITTDDTLEIARLLGQHGIIPEFSFILGNPPNPDADITSTFNFIKKVKHINPATEIILYLYSPEPVEGEMLDAAKAGGFRFPQTLEEWVGTDWGDFAHRHDPHTPWLRERHRRKVVEFSQVLNAYYPTTTTSAMRGWKGHIVRAAASWRYRSGFYRYPYELKALDKVLRYQRQDTRAC